ncbi:MAG TPA: LysR family transcriptional regulator [Ramlibacter sp.]|jgi:LysR family transcriptional regulator of gallate degradation
MLPLRHIRVMQSVARFGGVRSATDALLRVPSSISRSVALLEAAVGAALFERKGHGMLPTPTGELVLTRYARIRDELSAVLEEAAAAAGAGGLPAASLDTVYDERRLLAASLLAEVRHMPGAGRRLGVSQPAVSAAIARLENALRHKLFLRSARGVMPTELGERWIQRFDRVLAELRHLESDVGALQGRMTGLITVGALPLPRTHILPRAISALRAVHPGLRIHSLESPYEQLLAGLISGKVDFIIGAVRPVNDRTLTVEPLFNDELGVLAASSHALASRRRVGLADLRGQSWVLSRPGTPLRASLDAFFVAHGETAPVPAVETGDLALVRGLLMDGGMLTVLSTSQMRYEVNAGDLCVLPVSLEGLNRQIGITTRSGALLPAGVHAMLAEIRRASPRARGGRAPVTGN